jgi:hypothetical protein
VQPELTKLTAELDKTSNRLRKQYAAKVEEVIKSGFVKKSVQRKSRR